MRWPNFFIIGSAKSGTTSLYTYLKQHPEIFMSSFKEPNYFAIPENEPNFPNEESRIRYLNLKKQAIAKTDDYLSLFKTVNEEKMVGEASHMSLSLPYVAEKIFNQAPHSKLIAILRNPFDVAHSHFLMNQREGMQPSESDFLLPIFEPHIRNLEKIIDQDLSHWLS